MSLSYLHESDLYCTSENIPLEFFVSNLPVNSSNVWLRLVGVGTKEERET